RAAPTAPPARASTGMATKSGGHGSAAATSSTNRRTGSGRTSKGKGGTSGSSPSGAGSGQPSSSTPDPAGGGPSGASGAASASLIRASTSLPGTASQSLTSPLGGSPGSSKTFTDRATPHSRRVTSAACARPASSLSGRTMTCRPPSAAVTAAGSRVPNL